MAKGFAAWRAPFFFDAIVGVVTNNKQQIYMKKLFYLGIIGIILYEIAKVYFIMPMPGSQRMNSIEAAYFLHNWRWEFRIILWALILIATV